MGTIYLHRHKINRKCYVGQTIASVDSINSSRWCSGRGYDPKSLFGRAIKKYGGDSFEHIILKQDVPREELNKGEIYYISYFHSYVHDEFGGGYNATLGGDLSKYTGELAEDIGLQTNYNKTILRVELYNKFIETFPETIHTKQAVFARLKTLRLSDSVNINFGTDQELQNLKENYSSLPKQQLLDLFPSRTLEAIRTKAKELGLSRQVDCNSKYSQEELEIIKQNYSLYGLDYCAALLPNRTKQSIKDKATKKLHLKCHVKFTEEVGFNIQLFKDYYNSHSIKETADYFDLTKEQVIGIANRSNAKRDRNTVKTGIAPQSIICIEINKEFESAKQAGEVLNLGGAGKNILDCCKGKRKTAGGYHGKFVE